MQSSCFHSSDGDAHKMHVPGGPSDSIKAPPAGETRVQELERELAFERGRAANWERCAEESGRVAGNMLLDLQKTQAELAAARAALNSMSGVLAPEQAAFDAGFQAMKRDLAREQEYSARLRGTLKDREKKLEACHARLQSQAKQLEDTALDRAVLQEAIRHQDFKRDLVRKERDDAWKRIQELAAKCEELAERLNKGCSRCEGVGAARKAALAEVGRLRDRLSDMTAQRDRLVARLAAIEHSLYGRLN